MLEEIITKKAELLELVSAQLYILEDELEAARNKVNDLEIERRQLKEIETRLE